jgi:hypothetical protein
VVRIGDGRGRRLNEEVRGYLRGRTRSVVEMKMEVEMETEA